jgi:hypothetical protein
MGKEYHMKAEPAQFGAPTQRQLILSFVERADGALQVDIKSNGFNQMEQIGLISSFLVRGINNFNNAAEGSNNQG